MSFLRRIKDGITQPKAKIVVQFSKNSFVLGENVEGNLAVSSDEEFDAKEIRCEIQSVEEAKRIKLVYDETAKREVPKEASESETLYSARPTVTGPLHLTKGFSQTYPFSIYLPAGLRPTFKSLDSKITWTFKAAIAIEGRPDVTSQTVEIQVIQPTTPQVKEKEIIREVVMIPCKYCGALMPQTDTTCPRCGAKRTA